MMRKPAFARSSIAIFIAVMTALLALTAIVASREKELARGAAAGPGAFSTSAIGSAGFYEILRRMDIPVTRSTLNPLRDAGSHGVLIIGEPPLYSAVPGEEISGKIERSRRLLLVLPKWQWEADDENPEWVSRISPHDIPYVSMILSLVTIDGSAIVRAVSQQWTRNDFSFSPEIRGVAQLIRPSGRMRALVGGEDGALLIEYTEEKEDYTRVVWILSDPDVLSNHGIARGENAAFMVSVIKSLSAYGGEDYPGSGTIVFDETVHGFLSESSDSISKMMMKFPYVLITIFTVLSAILFVSAGAERFGAPIAAKPALDFGKTLLIDNGARLLDYGGHHAVTLERYARMIVYETAKALHAPEGLEGIRLAEWLDRVGESRKVSVPCSSILRGASDMPALMKNARNAHRWKKEILGKL